MKRKMHPEDMKNQLQTFGFIIRDEAFFKKSEEILKEFEIKKPKKVSDEEKEVKDAEG